MAALAAFGFALASFFLRFGQRKRPHDDGVFTLNVINLALNLPLAIIIGALGQLPPFNWRGVGFFVLGGVLTSFLGRIMWLRGIRLIGPARATSLEGTNPLFATLIAVLLLSERLPAVGWLGVVLCIGGILLLGNESRGGRRVEVPAEELAVAAAGAEMPAASTDVDESMPVPPSQSHPDGSARLGFFLSLASAVSFGAGAVVRKVALTAIPSPFVGAPVSSLTALVGMLGMDLSQGKAARLRDGLLHPPLGFIIAGLLTGLSQLLNLASLNLAPVSRVAVINATQPVQAVLIGAILFRQHDTINRRVFAASTAIVLGVCLVVLR